MEEESGEQGLWVRLKGIVWRKKGSGLGGGEKKEEDVMDGENGENGAGEDAGTEQTVDSGGNQRSNEKQKEKKEKPPQVGIVELFKYATKREKITVGVAVLAAAAHGAMLPLVTVVFGDSVESFTGSAIKPSEILSKGKWFAILGLIAFALGYVQSMLLTRVAYQQCTRIRRRYFRALMRQEFAWYDQNDTGELTARVASDVDLIQAGVGDKIGVAIQFTFTFTIGFIIGFIYSWKLTLVLLAVSPVLFIMGALLGKLTSDASGEGQGAYGDAGGIAYEALSMIRTVTAYGGQEEESRRYKKLLDKAYTSGVRKGHLLGLGFGATLSTFLLTYAVALYFGARLIGAQDAELSDVLTAFFAVVIGASSLGQIQPAFTAIVTAKGAAPRIFEIIARESNIDPLDSKGDILENVQGNIEFKNVSFSYAARSDHVVLKDLNLTVLPGATHALVGPSGCGKSTTVGLIERFYDVLDGSVLVDGVDVRTLNVQWLRSQIGYVSQEPSLFGISVRENIALGGDLEMYANPKTNENAFRKVQVSEEDVIKAAKLANAHDFIVKLPEGYSTVLGSGTSQLSGGQKQRVAIARALVRDPKILLLDEATSALDAKSEGIVQEALERAQNGRTTIVIAHRLSTIRNADSIAVFDEGRVVEQASHSNLIEKQDGAYRSLIELQNICSKREDEETDDSGGESELARVPVRAGTSETYTERLSIGKKASREVSTSLTNALEIERHQGVKEKDVDRGVLRRTFRASLGDLHVLLVGILGSIAAGTIFPILGVIFAEVIVKLGGVKAGMPWPDKFGFWILMFVVVAGVALLSNYIFFAMNAIVGERLTKRMRFKAFRALMKQEIGYFDMESNQIGSLTTKLATEATDMKGLVTGIFGTAAQVLSTLATGLIIALATCWRVALVVLALLPAVAVGQAFQVKATTGLDSDTKKIYADSGGTATEAVSNIRTVTGLGIQEHFCSIFNDKVDLPLKNGRKVSHVQGFFSGFGDFSMFMVFFLAFWAGSLFVERGQCSELGFFKAILSLIYTALSFGQMSAFAPDIAASRIGATRIYRLLDRVSKINPTSEGGQVLDKADGRVNFDKVEFKYPRRPEIPVLRGVTAEVQSSKTVAFVGASGSGKSTIVAMVERFYDPREGDVLLENVNLKALNVQSAREHISIVLQEGELFNRSIRDNIAYGFPKSEGTIVTDAQIVEAAKAANAHDFISEMPEQYDTLCGEKGSQLSGGQRQRVSIARALVRNPRVLLLDEATSALDAKSEALVQDALDKASEGRTTIVVAHRLSTVRAADKICVVSRGKIVESGAHDELMSRNGAYASLVRKQMTFVP